MNPLTDETMSRLQTAIVEGNRKQSPDLARELLNKGVNAYDIVMKGCSKAMSKVGDLYQQGEYFIPEILMSAKAFEAAMEVINPHLQTADKQASGTVVIGVCEGDIHTIGKNIVVTMLKAAGFDVVDLGADVAPTVFAEEAEKAGADIVAVSALMTTSMIGMKDVVAAVRERGLQSKIMIGGGPVSRDYAEQIGADGYGQDAKEAVDVALKLMEAV
ncbi:cobalamin-binding protein [Candidatus Thorarchaeota archaeon]|nr:MAG: cobalamin-binding protein [Candidatus Thorarchaeota archaeon]